MSNQEIKRATRSTKSEIIAKPTIAKSNTIVDKQSKDDKNDEFDVDFPLHDQFETNANLDLKIVEIDYETLLKKKKEKFKQFVAKREYQFLLRENQKLQASLRDDEINAKLTRRRRDNDSNNETLEENQRFVKRQRSTLDLKSTYLNNYYDKNFKK